MNMSSQLVFARVIDLRYLRALVRPSAAGMLAPGA